MTSRHDVPNPAEIGANPLDKPDAYGNDAPTSKAVSRNRNGFVIARKFGNLKAEDDAPSVNSKPEYVRLACHANPRPAAEGTIRYIYLLGTPSWNPKTHPYRPPSGDSATDERLVLGTACGKRHSRHLPRTGRRLRPPMRRSAATLRCLPAGDALAEFDTAFLPDTLANARTILALLASLGI
ncbi:MAG TPA: hypothetical protein VGC69_19315 [Bordetella sp.]